MHEWSTARRFGPRDERTRTFRPSVYALAVNERGQVAIVRAPDGTFLPGGGIDPNETPESALAREAMEECGWRIAVGDCLGLAVQATSLYEKPSSFFAISIVDDTGTPTEAGHTTLWLPPDQAAQQLMHESHAWAVREFAGRIGPGIRTIRPARRIIGFHQDAEQHWVADLECGHTQHVRHMPPWQLRPWVLTPEGRAGKIGLELRCAGCADGPTVS